MNELLFHLKVKNDQYSYYDLSIWEPHVGIDTQNKLFKQSKASLFI